MKRAIAAFALLLIFAAAANAESLVVSLSSHRVAITSSFTGQDLVLFGAIQIDATTERTDARYDVAVTVTGPRQTLRTRRKERVLGIWVNVDSRPFIQVPAYLAVLSNRPLPHITTAENLRRMQLGLENFRLVQRVGTDFADTVPDDPFRSAFIRISADHGLYSETAEAVTFITPTVFRAPIQLPAQVPTGTYQINVKLFADGALVTQANSSLQIIKAGFEEYIAEAARDHGFLYGLATALIALLTGWFASVVFRRD